MFSYNIMIGGPIHNKVWSIEPYLDSIIALDYPKENISLVFYVNDSTDGTKERLVAKVRELKQTGQYRRIVVKQQDYGYIDRNRGRENRNAFTNRPQNPFEHFAVVRNKWLELLADEDYVFSIDCDIILKNPSTLRKLISRNRDIIAVPVNNAENRSDNYDPAKEIYERLVRFAETPEEIKFWRDTYEKNNGGSLGDGAVWNFGIIRNGAFHRIKLLPEVFEVDVTGACILFRRKVVDDKIIYGANPIGEDAFWCSLAKSMGYRIFVDGTIETLHMMDFNPLTRSQ